LLPSRLGSGLVDLLIPDQCRLCGTGSERGGYCRDCAAALPRHPIQCRACGVPIAREGLCGRCQQDPPPIDETIAPFQYAPPVSDAIQQLKYHRKLACGRDLGILLARELEARLPELPDVLVPVPLHWKRLFNRGFNQAIEIAGPVSRSLNIPIDTSLVQRRLDTAHQVGLTPAQRRRNIRRAFACPERSLFRSAAILDDVVTSGATVAEVARCLRASGVDYVAVWALSRA
jgi:ComF family protein